MYLLRETKILTIPTRFFPVQRPKCVADYDDDTFEPQRSTEVLQSRETLNKLSGDIVLDDLNDSLENAEGALDRAEAACPELLTAPTIHREG